MVEFDLTARDAEPEGKKITLGFQLLALSYWLLVSEFVAF